MRDWIVCAENLHWLGIARCSVKLVNESLASKIVHVSLPRLSNDNVVEWRIALPEACETDSDYHSGSIDMVVGCEVHIRSWSMGGLTGNCGDAASDSWRAD